MIVINLWGAPSSGKSTNAAGLYYLMKIKKYKVELVREYVKDLIWDENYEELKKQDIIFLNQNQRQARFNSKLDYIITDSPLPLSFYYASESFVKENPLFEQEVWDAYNGYHNINFFVTQSHDFEDFGRLHNQSEAKKIEDDIRRIISNNSLPHIQLQTTPTLINDLLGLVDEIHEKTQVNEPKGLDLICQEVFDKYKVKSDLK